ncbi:MAG: VWA domain-containing protein [Calditrichaeota bacterium]|nr:VWA domain-containing protein [Calditrichota bacterium]
MTFLNPVVLFGLAAAAIPIIIHFLTRQKAKVIPFSSLRFLKLLENQQIRRLRWKQILLLIIRTLIILLIVLAFARPTIKNRGFWGVGSKANTAAVLILDNSLSMGVEQDGALLYDTAKRIVFEMENIFSAGDEIYGVFATPGVPPIFEGPRYNFSTVKKIIQKTTVTQQRTDFVSAIVKAKEILAKASPVNKEIYLISDLQTSGWLDTARVSLPLMKDIADEKINLIIIPVRKKSVSNLSVARITINNQIIEKGKVLEVSAVVKNFGSEPAKSRLLQIFLDGKRVGQATVSLSRGEMKTVNFKIVPEKVGFSAGSVLLEDDDLFADNKGYFTFETPEQVKVLFIAPQEKDVRFFRLALNPTPDSESRIRTSYIAPGEVSFNRVKDFDVIILSDIKRVEGNLLNSLKNHLESGKGLILFPGSDMDLRQLNDNLNRELSLPEFTATEGKLGQKDFFLSLGKFDQSHPIFSGIFENNNKKFSSPSFNFLVKFRLKPEHSVVMRFSNGEPFLVESNFQGGKCLVFASTAAPSWSDFYLKGIFVPLLHRAVMYLANTGKVNEQQLFVGDKIGASVANVGDFAELEMEKPDGTRQKVIPAIKSGALKINFTETNSSGVYRLYQKEKLLGDWAVNCDPEESDFSYFSETQLKKVVGKAVMMNVENVASLTDEIRAVRYGRELWKLFAAAAFVLLLIEMWLSRESGTPKNKKEGAIFERNV